MCRGLRYKEERHELREGHFHAPKLVGKRELKVRLAHARRRAEGGPRLHESHLWVTERSVRQRSSNTGRWAIGAGAARRTHPWLIRAADVGRSHRVRSRLAAAIRRTALRAKRRMLGGGDRVRALTPPRTIKHHTLTRQSHRHAAAARCRTTRPSVTLATPLLRGAPRPFRHSRRDVRRHSARSENTGVLHHGRPTFFTASIMPKRPPLHAGE